MGRSAVLVSLVGLSSAGPPCTVPGPERSESAREIRRRFDEVGAFPDQHGGAECFEIEARVKAIGKQVAADPGDTWLQVASLANQKARRAPFWSCFLICIGASAGTSRFTGDLRLDSEHGIQSLLIVVTLAGGYFKLWQPAVKEVEGCIRSLGCEAERAFGHSR